MLRLSLQSPSYLFEMVKWQVPSDTFIKISFWCIPPVVAPCLWMAFPGQWFFPPPESPHLCEQPYLLPSSESNITCTGSWLSYTWLKRLWKLHSMSTATFLCNTVLIKCKVTFPCQDLHFIFDTLLWLPCNRFPVCLLAVFFQVFSIILFFK